VLPAQLDGSIKTITLAVHHHDRVDVRGHPLLRKGLPGISPDRAQLLIPNDCEEKPREP
jgi:hypothetical protein